YAQAQTKQPDVIKLATLARTPEEAWPLLQILAKPALPTVVVGLGKPGIMLSVLGKKIGSPWTYAALEKGMETYPGQPTVRELNDVYHYPMLSPVAVRVPSPFFFIRNPSRISMAPSLRVPSQYPS